MKLHVEHTADAGIADCYQALSDFDGMLQSGKQGSLQLSRLDAPAPVCKESRWDGQLELHGLRKPVTIGIESLSPPNGYVLVGQSEGIKARITVSLSAITSERTLMAVDFDLGASSLAGKLLLKSLQVMQTRVEERLAGRLARLL